MEKTTFTKRTKATYTYGGKVFTGEIIGVSNFGNPFFQADNAVGYELYNNPCPELFDGCKYDREKRNVVITPIRWDGLETVLEIGTKVTLGWRPDETFTIVGYVPNCASPYIVTDKDGESKLKDGEKFRPCDVNFYSRNEFEPVQEKPEIEITVKVNGKEVALSEISQETLLAIRKNS